ncbi:hypothetical protein MMC17_006623 [Xylographa soralifera]|nr:hypothetical protein [Xylographa soralifera]
MARTKHNGVRDGALTFKKRTGVDLNPLVRATPEELAKYNADWKRLRAKWAREKEELRKKEWEVMEAYWAKMDIEEKEKPRRPCPAALSAGVAKSNATGPTSAINASSAAASAETLVSD